MNGKYSESNALWIFFVKFALPDTAGLPSRPVLARKTNAG